MNRQSGQALVEWGLSAFVLMLFAFGLLAVGQIVGEDTAVRSAASQAAFAAARAPSAAAAQQYGQAAAAEAIQGTQIKDFQVTIDTGSFQRGSILTVTARGYVNLTAFPGISQVLGGRVVLTWQAHALIEPYRSRTP
jgi:Flp pilus assembly protein TadG